MQLTSKFTHYSIVLQSGSSGHVAMIACLDHGRFIGRIDFHDEWDWEAGYSASVSNSPNYPAPVPPNGYYIFLNMPTSRLDAVLSTLRQEAPLALTFASNTDGPNTLGHGSLVTLNDEPVGEEEGAGKEAAPLEATGLRFFIPTP
jgi:hypothetical protein